MMYGKKFSITFKKEYNDMQIFEFSILAVQMCGLYV